MASGGYSFMEEVTFPARFKSDCVNIEGELAFVPVECLKEIGASGSQLSFYNSCPFIVGCEIKLA